MARLARRGRPCFGSLAARFARPPNISAHFISEVSRLRCKVFLGRNAKAPQPPQREFTAKLRGACCALVARRCARHAPAKLTIAFSPACTAQHKPMALARTRTRTNTIPDGSEASASGRSARACVARESKRERERRYGWARDAPGRSCKLGFDDLLIKGAHAALDGRQ